MRFSLILILLTTALMTMIVTVIAPKVVVDNLNINLSASSTADFTFDLDKILAESDEYLSEGDDYIMNLSTELGESHAKCDERKNKKISELGSEGGSEGNEMTFELDLLCAQLEVIDGSINGPEIETDNSEVKADNSEAEMPPLEDAPAEGSEEINHSERQNTAWEPDAIRQLRRKLERGRTIVHEIADLIKKVAKDKSVDCVIDKYMDSRTRANIQRQFKTANNMIEAELRNVKHIILVSTTFLKSQYNAVKDFLAQKPK